MRNAALIFFLPLALAGFACNAECIPGPERLCPNDESTEDASFAAFRDKLIHIVERRDWAALSGIVADDIHVSFGPGNGKRAFVEQWQPQDAGSPLWKEFEDVLSLGGAFIDEADTKTYCAPYVYTDFPAGRDAFLYHAVTGANIPLRVRPDIAAETIATLDHALVRTEPGLPEIHRDAAGNAWITASHEGKSGYVQAEHVRSPLDYRACFALTKDGWKLKNFIAGD